jgi:hypothetical protein
MLSTHTSTWLQTLKMHFLIPVPVIALMSTNISPFPLLTTPHQNILIGLMLLLICQANPGGLPMQLILTQFL